jgi:hypothetical protein
MRCTPPKMVTATIRVRAMPVMWVGTPKASSSDDDAVKDCRATKARPKVTSSSTVNTMPSARLPSPRSM